MLIILINIDAVPAATSHTRQSVKEFSAMLSGLDDVIAAETILSAVDGEAGTLVIRGHPMAALAGRVPYERVISILWNGFFDELPEGDRLSSALGRARAEVFERMQAWL